MYVCVRLWDVFYVYASRCKICASMHYIYAFAGLYTYKNVCEDIRSCGHDYVCVHVCICCIYFFCLQKFLVFCALKRYLLVCTFHMLASFPYTTAMLLTLFCWMLLFSVSFSSSETKPMNELSGV